MFTSLFSKTPYDTFYRIIGNSSSGLNQKSINYFVKSSTLHQTMKFVCLSSISYFIKVSSNKRGRHFGIIAHDISCCVVMFRQDWYIRFPYLLFVT